MTRARELARLANENVFTAEDYNSPVQVGINSTDPTSTLDVRGELKVGTAIQAGTAGVVTATEFSGSIGTFSGAGSFGGNLDVTGNVTVGGTLTYEDVTNIDSVGVITARAGVNVSGGEFKVGTAITFGSAGVSTFFGAVNLNKKTTVNATLEATEGLNVTAGVSTFAGNLSVAQNIIHTGDTDTKIHFSAADQISLDTGGTTRVNITSGGNLEMPNDNDYIKIGAGGDLQLVHTGSASIIADSGAPLEIRSDTFKVASGVGTEAFRVDSNGRLILGATSVSPANSYSDNLVVSEAAGDAGISIHGNNSNSNYASLYFGDAGAAQRAWIETQLGSGGNLTIGNGGVTRFYNNGAERMRVDSSGRLIIGATSSRTVFGNHNSLQVEGLGGGANGVSITRNTNDAWYPYLTFGKSRGTSDGSSTIVQSGDSTGVISFNGADGGDMNNQTAQIESAVDGTPGVDDMPGRLMFYTTADGAASGTERLRLTSEGRLLLNTTDATGDSDAEWNDTAPTSSVFSVGTGDSPNKSGDAIIAYLWTEKQGFSKFGTYTGNGNADGAFIYTGFRPACVIMKCSSDNATPWLIWDNKRPGYNLTNLRLRPSAANAEDTSTADPIDILSNGFKCRGTNDDSNKDGSTFIYMAFAEAPFVNSNGVPCNAR